MMSSFCFLGVLFTALCIASCDSDCYCQEIFGSSCAHHFGADHWAARFPNARELDLFHSLSEFQHFEPILVMDNYCSHVLHNLLCFHYFPKCDLENHSQLGATPCRETCIEATTACIEHVRAIQNNPLFEFPEHLNCNNFANGSQCCITVSEVSGENDDECDSLCTACPSANIHVEFATEAGKRTFSVSESTGSAQICLRLANVGSYNPNDTLKQAVIVNLLTVGNTAEEDFDFIWQDVNVNFPVGAKKGEIRCITIEIVIDDVNEGIEVFTIQLDIIFPFCALYGRAIQTTSGSIQIRIIDQPSLAAPVITNPPLPDPKINVVFATCKERFVGSEGTGTAEICLQLASVGSYNTFDILKEDVFVNLYTMEDSALEGLDFIGHNSIIVFPVGAGLGEARCISIEIVMDDINEDMELFIVHAVIICPPCAQFCGSFSANGSIEVEIINTYPPTQIPAPITENPPTPDPKINVVFATCDNRFIGLESDGSVEICLRLANVGSYNLTDTLQENVAVNMGQMGSSAEEWLDFIGQNSTIVFPVGAGKGEIHCITIEIVIDNIVEGTEVFVDFANILSPLNASFAGSQLGTGSIEVYIIDQIPPPEPVNIIFTAEDQFVGSEKNGTAEICLKLVSVGSDNDVESITVNLHAINKTANEGVDFIFQPTDLVFPMVPGYILCVTIDIVQDNEYEDTEVFIVHANITSPSNALFGDVSLQSRNGSIEVNITDHCPMEMPDPVIPADECKATCNWRNSFSGNTFKKNPYTFVAHIRVLDCKGSVLNVDILDCRDNGVCGVCPMLGCFKIAFCPNCLDTCPVGEEFIIAGKHTPDGLYIGNSKKGGVFVPYEGDGWIRRVKPCT